MNVTDAVQKTYRINLHMHTTDSDGKKTPEEAIEIYKGRLRRAPSTPQLADELGISRPTLDRVFAADMGMSPAAVLRSLRLSEAKRRLAAGQNSISEIAYSLGFCNPAHFSNVFRAETGVPPRNWEKRIGSG